jgi:hypothetical protein
MKTIEDQMAFYAAYHQDPRNKATHFVGVPAIMVSLFIPLAWIRFDAGGVTLTAAMLFAAVGGYRSSYICWRKDRRVGNRARLDLVRSALRRRVAPAARGACLRGSQARARRQFLPDLRRPDLPKGVRAIFPLTTATSSPRFLK